MFAGRKGDGGEVVDCPGGPRRRLRYGRWTASASSTPAVSIRVQESSSLFSESFGLLCASPGKRRKDSVLSMPIIVGPPRGSNPPVY